MSSTLSVKVQVENKDKAASDLNQIKEQVSDINKTTVSPKVDTKEFDKGTIKGAFKDIQENLAAFANGGVSRGFSQLGASVKSFTSELSAGKTVGDAFATGIHQIGIEGFAVGTVLTGVGQAALQLGQAMVEAYLATERLETTARQAGTSITSLNDATSGLISVQQALTLHQSALSNGLSLQGEQLEMVSREAARFSQVTGTDLNQSLGLVQQALSGNAGAARQLGVSVNDTATRAEVLTRTLSDLQQRSNDMGAVNLDPGQELEKVGKDIKDIITEILAVGGRIIVDFVKPFIDGIKEIIDGAKSVRAALHDWLGESEATTTNLEQQRRIQRDILAGAHQQAQLERDRARSQAIQLQDNVSAANQQATYWGVGARNAMDALTTSERLAQSHRELLDIHQREGETDSDFEQRRAAAQTRYVNAAREDTSRRNERFEREINLGVQQHQLRLQGSSLSLGVAELTTQQAIRQVRGEINRQMQLSLYTSNGISQAASDYVDRLNQMLSGLETTAYQANEQLNQQLEAVRQLERERDLRIWNNDLQHTQEGTTDRIARLSDASVELHRRINDFTFDTHGNLERQTQQYQRLVSMAQMYDAELQSQLEHQHAQAIALDDKIKRQSRIAGEIEPETVKQLISEERSTASILRNRVAINDAQIQYSTSLTTAALQQQAEGARLTSQQQAAISNQQELVNLLNEQHSLLQSQLEANAANLAAADTDQKRNQYLRERIELRRQLEGNEEAKQTLEQSQQGVGALQRLTGALHQYAGESRSASATLGDAISGAVGSFAGAIKSHMAAVIQGKETIGQALQATLSEVLTTLASESAVKAIFSLAEGFAYLAQDNYKSAAQSFTASAIYGSVAGVAGVAAMAVGTPSTSTPSTSSSGGSSLPSGPSSPANNNAGGTGMVINIQGKLFLTQEEVEDALYRGVRRAQNRAA